MNAVLKTLRWPSTDRDRKRLALWTADEVAEATGGTASAMFQAAGVEMDSRDVRSGDLFFALKGESLEMVQDLVVAASNAALKKAQEMVDAELEKVTKGIKMPGIL